MIVTKAPGGGDRADRGTDLTVEGAEVSAVLRDGGQLIVRVFNPTDADTTVRIAGRHGWLVDLRGRPIERFDRSFALAPWRIATAQLALTVRRLGKDHLERRGVLGAETGAGRLGHAPQEGIGLGADMRRGSGHARPATRCPCRGTR